MAKVRTRKPRRTPRLIVALLILVLLGVAGFYWQWQRTSKHSARTSSPGASQATQDAAAKADVENNKQALANQNPPSQATKDNGQTSPPAASGDNVIISYAGEEEQTVKVSSYVTGVFEDGGTCTLTLSKDGSNVTRTQTGIADATHTTCPTFSIDNNGHGVMSAGTWSAVVSYKSTNHSGTSAAKTFEVK